VIATVATKLDVVKVRERGVATSRRLTPAVGETHDQSADLGRDILDDGPIRLQMFGIALGDFASDWIDLDGLPAAVLPGPIARLASGHHDLMAGTRGPCPAGLLSVSGDCVVGEQ
jgi:hypothetical protein